MYICVFVCHAMLMLQASNAHADKSVVQHCSLDSIQRQESYNSSNPARKAISVANNNSLRVHSRITYHLLRVPCSNVRLAFR